ncbi:MAG: VOC family protein [Myxococcota bacterium]
MPANPPEDTPRVTPYLLYEDVGAALTFLSSAFGFAERMRIPNPDGSVGHAEAELADGVIMLGCPGADYQNPKHCGHSTSQVYVYVDDVDAHFEQARAAGAIILEEPADQFYGDRRYGATDPEGHVWYFAQHVRDVAPEDMHP